MQKPPETGGSHEIRLYAALDHHRRDDEDLCRKRDNASCRGFENAHYIFLFTGACSLPHRIWRSDTYSQLQR